MEKFVKIPNRVFAYEDEKCLTEDELIIFYEVCYHASLRYGDANVSIVNVELLYSRLQWDKGKASRGKKRIVSALEGLQHKGYLSIAYTGKKITNTAYLTITVLSAGLCDEKVKSGRSVYNGHTQLTEEDYQMAQGTGERLKVILYTMWRSNIGYSISYKEWAAVLFLCERQAKTKIEKYVKEGLINKISGAYYEDEQGKPKQERNIYSVGNGNSKFAVVEEEIKETRNNIVKEVSERKTETHEHNWYATIKTNLTVDDMVLYLRTTDEKLKQHAEKKIAIISKSTKGKYVMDKLLSDAKARIQKEEREMQRKKNQQEQMLYQEKIKQMEGTPVILKSGEIVTLTSDIDVKDIDKICYFKKEVEYNFYRESEKEYLEEKSLYYVFLEEKHVDKLIISPETMEKVEQRFIEVALQNKYTHKDIVDLVKYFDEVCKRLNYHRAYNVEWEGDEMYFDGVELINESLKLRTRKKSA